MCKALGEEARRLRIISDGTTRGTRVETEDGELVAGVVEVAWQHRAGKMPQAKLSVLGADFHIIVIQSKDLVEREAADE
jgi:hypothetical protein